MCKHLQIFKRKEYSENKSGRKSKKKKKNRSKRSTKNNKTQIFESVKERLSVFLCKALDFKKFGKTLSFSIFACKYLGVRENPKSFLRENVKREFKGDDVEARNEGL